MNEPKNLADLVEQIRARIPKDLPPLTQEEIDADRFDPIAWRVERTEGVLARRIRMEFQEAKVEHPRIARWVREFVDNSRGVPSLILLGLRGTGKTHAAYGVLRETALAFAHLNKTLRWEFRTHVQLAGDVRPRPDDEHLSKIYRYKTCDLLFLDDLTSARISDWGAEALLDIVDTRWADHLPMVITANTDADELDEAVGDRIASRLLDSVRVGFSGPDRRVPGGAR
jgi:DNA replication protein DnaC